MPAVQFKHIQTLADKESLQCRVQRHSPHRLLREKLVLPGGITISAEKHRGRVMVRVEVPVGRGGCSLKTADRAMRPPRFAVKREASNDCN
jgi:hypothetical protein